MKRSGAYCGIKIDRHEFGEKAQAELGRVLFELFIWYISHHACIKKRRKEERNLSSVYEKKMIAKDTLSGIDSITALTPKPISSLGPKYTVCLLI